MNQELKNCSVVKCLTEIHRPWLSLSALKKTYIANRNDYEPEAWEGLKIWKETPVYMYPGFGLRDYDILTKELYFQ